MSRKFSAILSLSDRSLIAAKVNRLSVSGVVWPLYIVQHLRKPEILDTLKQIRLVLDFVAGLDSTRDFEPDHQSVAFRRRICLRKTVFMTCPTMYMIRIFEYTELRLFPKLREFRLTHYLPFRDRRKIRLFLPNSLPLKV